MRKLLVAAALAVAPLVWAVPAHADDDDGVRSSICTAWTLGEDPGQIASQLTRGQPGWNEWRSAHKVWDTLQEGC